MNYLKSFLLAVLILITSNVVLSQSKKPLLIPGKHSLYQRILSLPGAKLYSQAKELNEDIELSPFSVYYVYQRSKDENQRNWMQIGLGSHGNIVGWIDEKKSLQWYQGLTLSFRDPKERDRVLLFKDKASVQTLVENYDIDTYKKFYAAASQGERMANSPVVAIQPAEAIDISKNFYLLPIHDYEEVFLKDYSASLLQVSSIPIKKKKIPEQKSLDTSAYTAGITFVIDSTLSMQPYIDQTRLVAKEVYKSLQRKNLTGYVHFGLIAFRDNVSVAPGIEYLTHKYVSLEQGSDAKTFFSGINALKAADERSKGFKEDSFSGIKKALNQMDWSRHAARYIVLVTDAGSRGANDPLSGTGLDAVALNKLAIEKNVAIFVLHLLTPDKLADQDSARKQYRLLSYYPGVGSLYYGVKTGDPIEFGNALGLLSKQISSQVEQVKAHKDDIAVEQKEKAVQSPSTDLLALKEKVAKLGHALRMQYLQGNSDDLAPDVFKAWILDKEFQHPDKYALDVRVLLSRDQLSDLYDILKKVLETAEEGLISPTNFINDLKSLAATTSRDPSQLGTTTAATAESGSSLAELGFMREYIEDLPYSGEIINLSLDEWQRWTVKQQVAFLSKLEKKISYYQTLHDDFDKWVSLDGGEIDGDAVYPIPLDMLP